MMVCLFFFPLKLLFIAKGSLGIWDVHYKKKVQSFNLGAGHVISMDWSKSQPCLLSSGSANYTTIEDPSGKISHMDVREKRVLSSFKGHGFNVCFHFDQPTC